MKQHPSDYSESLLNVEPVVGQRIEDVERALILATLGRCGGNRTWAAEVLGVSVRTLRNKLLRYRETAGFPPPEGEDSLLARLENFDPGKLLPS